MWEKRQSSAAVSCYAEALQSFRTGQWEQARKQLARVFVLDAENLQGHLLEAYIYRAQQQPVAEVRSLVELLRLLSVEPQAEERQLAAEAYSLLGAAFSMLGKNQAAKDAFVQSARLEIETKQKLAEYSNAIFVSNYLAEERPEAWKELYAAYGALLPEPVFGPDIYHHKRLRIGYLSADFRQHPVAYLVCALLQYYDKNQFEVYCYAANPADDMTARLQQWGTQWRDVQGQEMAAIAEMIRLDEIDILMDLSGHTNQNLLPVLAYRPACIQISGIGYFNSTGMQAVDYFLSDIYCAAGRENPAMFTEKLLVLPHTHFCFSLLHPMPEAGEAPCRRNGYVTFGCFNNFAKVTDQMLQLWGQILMQLPTARLLLKHRLFDTQEGRQYVFRRMQRCGIPRGRVDFEGLTEDYLHAYHRVDIALDTYPYVGGMTTFEALYMGVPVVTLYGERHGTRFGYSMLKNIGLAELANAAAGDYRNCAIRLAQNLAMLSRLHCELRTRVEQSYLMDSKRYVEDMEHLYIESFCGSKAGGK